MDAPSASPAADANNVKDEDAGETKEDDGDNEMLGTNEVGCICATPAAPTTPILVAGEVDLGLYSVTRRNDVAQNCAATRR